MKWLYDKPASDWSEADPLGNGHMGAMVYGGIFSEQIDLSELTFFSGAKSMEKDNQEDAAKAFDQMRRMAGQDDFEGITRAAEKFIGKQNNYGTNLPVGKLMINFEATHAYSNYTRSLDYERGIWNCSYTLAEENEIKRECFLSWPDKVLVYRMASESSINFQLRCLPGNSQGNCLCRENQMMFHAFARENVHSDGICGVNLIGGAVIKTDGEVIALSEDICIKQAKNFCLYLTMETDFNREVSADEMMNSVRKHLVHCMEKGDANIKNDHIADISSYMERCSLTLNSENETENEMIPGMFQYGRYLLLASSREDSRLPAHLQGIWNDNVACQIGWSCDMHLDINTQMNYWPANLTGLTACNRPLFRWITEVLIPSGQVSARESYGLGGWIGEIVSNAWGFSAPYWATPLAPCPTGGIWILSHMWEHGWYTMDKEFMKLDAWPAMRLAAEFFLEYIFETEPGSGVYTCGPAISPENSFIKDGKFYHISNGCTYELVMIRELFEQLIKIERFLEVTSTEGKKAAKILPKLKPYRVNEDGTLAEWNHDFPAGDLQHRHLSHLLGLYPFAQITKAQTKELALAAEKTINQRLNPEENWENTGWARAMMLLFAARLKNGEQARKHLNSMLTKLLGKNHMIIHPPTRGAGSFANVYELDGNTGFTSGVAEMLLQSHGDVIELLPAIPEDWKCGEVKGLRARGGFQVSFAWENGKVTQVEVSGSSRGACKLEYNGNYYIFKQNNA